MKNSDASSFFNEEQAAGYDDRWKKAAPMREALDFLMQAVLQDLSSEARILCVGAGTGVELLSLAQKFPKWRFMAVEPSAPMLSVCRKKAEEAGISSRCEFHEGYLNSLPSAEFFDAATSILVSQFLTDPDQREDFFRQIAKRLRPGGYLVNADLFSVVSAVDYDSLVDVWLKAQGLPPESAAAMCAAWEKSVAISTPKEVESIIVAAGFEHPIQFYQALFIHAWYARTPL